MTQLTIEYPERLPDALQQTRADFEQEVKMADELLSEDKQDNDYGGLV
jgi:hypothetical protein